MAEVVLRAKRQLTLPRGACQQLGVAPGDRLGLTVEGDALLLRPLKRAALDALRELQAILAQTGVREEELLAGGRRLREEIHRQRYGLQKT
ncbi:MAG TPA: AbrB/MazE/SpoVT family DNA-binding domain-containing protein [Dehalococcoidia bacterium]|nr:AbrB/MazE/SpoVT family DNA-binding domain-containing protein [Dehalococcoidia bacterium]